MLFVSLFIIVIIVIIEAISIYVTKERGSVKFTAKHKKTIKKDSVSFIKLTLNDSLEIIHKPGYIYTENNENLFIIHDNTYILMKKDIIYNIDNEFKLEFILLGDKIDYFYYEK